MQEHRIVGEPIGKLFGFFAGETPTSSPVPVLGCAKEADHRAIQADAQEVALTRSQS